MPRGRKSFAGLLANDVFSGEFDGAGALRWIQWLPVADEGAAVGLRGIGPTFAARIHRVGRGSGLQLKDEARAGVVYEVLVEAAPFDGVVGVAHIDFSERVPVRNDRGDRRR